MSVITATELEQAYPTIPWREPILVTLSGKKGLACRICIAQVGLKGTDHERLFDTPDEHAEHVASAHTLPL